MNRLVESGLAVYRLRGALIAVGAVVLFASTLLGPILASITREVRLGVSFTGMGVLLVGGVVSMIGPRLIPERSAVDVTPPVTGRWLAMNSPASKVPSHGVRAYGQAYAIDLVAEPAPGGREAEAPLAARPEFGSTGAMRDPADYPAFGAPVRAMIEGTVVRASGWRRDHRARSNMLGIIYMMIEGAVRECGGPGFIVGNHVVIRGADGVYALLAHLKRGSITVRPGEAVRPGDAIAQCGNSGNSSEPHVHAQLMDRASATLAIGVPMRFVGISLDEDRQPVTGLPRTEQHMTA